MATNFIECNLNHNVIRQAVRGAQLMREAESQIAAALLGMEQMKVTGSDGTDPAHFALLTTECEIQQNGYASANAAAKKLYDETNSVAGNAAAGIAAAKQLCAYLGV